MNYAGSDWVERSYKIQLSPFATKVADLLGCVYKGIYHLNDCHSLRKVDWTRDFIEVFIDRPLSTYDSEELTALVLLAHDLCVRVEMTPHMRYIKLLFSDRTREGDWYHSHPTIEDHIKKLRETYGLEGVESKCGS
jgi:hypothetical protein